MPRVEIGSAARNVVAGCASTLLSVTAATTFAQQQAPAAPMSWVCWLQPRESSTLHCREAGGSGSAELLSLRTDPLPLRYRDDLFADPMRRNITRLVRTAPALYANRIWSIPLISPPIDTVRARDLAYSIMCGREIDCDVDVAIVQ